MANKSENKKENNSKKLDKNSLSHFEKEMKELESIVTKMSEGNLSLEKSVELFETGMQLSKKCSNKLTHAEQMIQKVIHSNKMDANDNLKLEKISFSGVGETDTDEDE